MFGSVGVVNPVLPLYVVDTLHHPPNTIGLVVAVYAIATLAVRPFVGFWVDRSGHRRVFTIGAAGIGVASALYPLSGTAGLLALDRAAVGAGLALVLAAAPLWAVALVPAERGSWALGLVGVVSAAAQAVGAPVGEGMYRLGGDRLVAAVAGLLPVCGLLLVRTLQPVARPATEGATRPTAGTWYSAVKPALLPGVCLMMTGFGYASILAFLVVALDSRGVSGGSLALTAYALAFMAVRLATRRWTDRLGVSRTLAATCVTEVTGLILLAFAGSLPTALVGAILVGSGSAHMYPAFGEEVLAAANASGRQAIIAVYGSFVQLGMAVAAPCSLYSSVGPATRRCSSPPAGSRFSA
jgi:MFS family permease